MNDYPLIKFVLIFIAGIIFQSVFQITLLTLVFTLFGSVAVVITLQFLKKPTVVFIRASFIFIPILLIGMISYGLSNSHQLHYPFKSEKYNNAILFGSIENIELKQQERIVVSVRSDSIKTSDGIYTGKQFFLCSIYDDDNLISKLYDNLAIGNKVELTGVLKRIKNERNPFEFDYEKYLNQKGIIAVFASYKSSNLKIISAETDFFPKAVFTVRKSIDWKISELHNHGTAALLRGLLLADRSMIDYDTRTEFVNAGVIHVLAVSGLHVGYIVLIFVLLFNRFNIYFRFGLTILGLLIFMVVTGMQASVIRATIMSIVVILCQFTGRDYNSVNSIALAALIILILDPLELFNPGFQLSFSAVLSIVLIYPHMSRAINSWKIKSQSLKWLLMFFAVSFSAQIGTLPFTLVYFNKLSLVALLANLLVIPLIGFILGLGLLTLFLGSFAIMLASVFASTNELLSYFLFQFVGLMGNDKLSYVAIHQFTIYDAIIFYLTLVTVFYIFTKFSVMSAKAIASVLLIITAVLFIRLDNKELLKRNELSFMAIDVGQGNAILVKFPNGQTALIDAGNYTQYFDNGERVIIPLLDKLGIDQIDYGIVSHIDSDHSGGFVALAKKNKVRIILKPQLDAGSLLDKDFEKLLRNYHIPYKYFSKEKFAIGNARLYVLNDSLKNYSAPVSSNDRSGIIRIVYGNNSILLTGDASIRIEREYLEKYGSFLSSNVLLVGHHGSRTSTGDEFLSQVHPSFAVISAGVANKFNHPHYETIQKLEASGAKILRTDMKGAVIFASDGFNIKQIHWREEESKLKLLL